MARSLPIGTLALIISDVIMTLLVLVGLLVTLVRGLAGPAVSMMAAAATLLLLGVITPAEAFAGFSSTAVMSVAALFIVAGAVESTGILNQLVARVVTSGSTGLPRLLVPVAACSSFMNNTPIVAAMAPAVASASTRAGVPSSRFLMPLSYATILGGVVTTIGTSTNLVVSGLLVERGQAPLGLFEMSPIGLPLAAAGITLLCLTSSRLVPDRVSPDAQVAQDPQRYALDLQVVPDGPLEGVRAAAAGLRDMAGVFLAARTRDGVPRPLDPGDRLCGGDVLTFVGDVVDVTHLTAGGGLRPLVGAETILQDSGILAEAIVSANSDLVGQTLKEVGFRSRHGAVVMAIHRDGAPQDAKLGGIRLRAGDALTVLCGPASLKSLQRGDDFSVVATADPTPADDVRLRRPLILVIAGAMVLAALLGVDILLAALAAVLTLLATRCATVAQARSWIDIDVLVVIAGSFALGAAVEASGLAGQVARAAADMASTGGRPLAVLGVVLLTMALTEPLSNAAAAALMVPIALDVADRLGGDPRTFAIGVAVAASASFLTPIGYQTNTMVYGLGGYRFGDYARLGTPITLLSLLVTTGGVLLLAF